MIASRGLLVLALTAMLATAAAATAPASPIPAAPAGFPVSTIDLGPAPLYAQGDDTSVLAGIQIFVRAGLDRENPAQSGLAALAAETILLTPVDGVPLKDAIATHGGSLATSAGPQYVRFYLQGQPASLGALATLFARALAKPDSTPVALAAARSAIGIRSSEDEANPIAVGLEMVRQSYYDNGAALPIYGTTATLANQTGADVQAFIAAHYVRANAIVSAAGRLTPNVTAAAKTLAAAFSTATDAPVKTTAKPFGPEPKEIITHRDIGVPYLVMGFAAPSVTDRDFPAMLVLRALLGDAFDRPSATTLPFMSRAVGAVYIYDAQPAEFAVYINGSQLDPARGLSAVQGIIAGLSAKPMNADTLKRYRTIAHGQWATEDISLADRAFAIGNFVAFGAAPDSGARVAAAIDTVSAADVQRAAVAYLEKFTVALIIPRNSAPAKPAG